MYLKVLLHAVTVPEVALSLLDLVLVLCLVFQQPLSKPFTSVKPLCPSLYGSLEFVKSVP